VGLSIASLRAPGASTILFAAGEHQHFDGRGGKSS
jgi:hypothetical protein